MMADDSTLLSGVSELDAIPPQSQVLTEQRLKYWFKLADPINAKYFPAMGGKTTILLRFCACAQAFSVFILQR